MFFHGAAPQWLYETILTFNIEGYKCNRFYLSNIVKKYKPLFINLQETWLPSHEAHIIGNDFNTDCKADSILTKPIYLDN